MFLFVPCFSMKTTPRKPSNCLDLKKTKEKNPAKQESLVFLERTVHRVGKKTENQRKSREKSKVAENQVFWLDFCARKNDCAYTLGNRTQVAGEHSSKELFEQPMLFLFRTSTIPS
jgi:hypothetical protein